MGKKKSIIWNYFTEEDGKVKCNIADCEVSSVHRKAQETTSMWEHLKNKHDEIYNQIKDEKLPSTNKRKSTVDGNQSLTKKPIQKRRKKEAETAIMKMLARRNAPFTLVDDPLFKRMLTATFKDVKHCGARYYSTKVLPAVANDILEKLRCEVGSSYYSITTDGWSAGKKPSPSYYRQI